MKDETGKKKKFLSKENIAFFIAVFVFITGMNMPDVRNWIEEKVFGVKPIIQENAESDRDMDYPSGMFHPVDTQTPKASPVITNSPAARISLTAGSIVSFGKYKNEEISWYVVDLDQSADTALLVSVKAVDVVQYHSSTKTIPWANCDLRNWLNNTFYQAAFSQSEKEVIQTSSVEGSRDKVYILSQQEANQYLNNMGGSWLLYGTSLCYTSGTVTGKPIYVNSSSGGSPWWLRSAMTGETANLVGAAGKSPVTNHVNNPPTAVDNGVRPVILVSLNLFR